MASSADDMSFSPLLAEFLNTSTLSMADCMTICAADIVGAVPDCMLSASPSQQGSERPSPPAAPRAMSAASVAPVPNKKPPRPFILPPNDLPLSFIQLMAPPALSFILSLIEGSF